MFWRPKSDEPGDELALPSAKPDGATVGNNVLARLVLVSDWPTQLLRSSRQPTSERAHRRMPRVALLEEKNPGRAVGATDLSGKAQLKD